MQESIRRIHADEATLLRDLRLRALADSPEAFGPRHAEITARPMDYWTTRVQEYATSEDAATFLLFRHGEPVGMTGAFLEGHRRDHAYLVAMWVDPAHRRGGAGARMVDTAARWLADLGVELIQAWVVERNLAALRFYETLGFVRTEQRRVWHGQPEVLLIFDTALL
jgi:RimJ/RimL family protein N-acetyltransferase